MTVRRITVLVIAGLLIASSGVLVSEALSEPVESEAFEYIAFSRIKGIDDAPANTAEHFKLCCSQDYRYDMLKGDIRLTLDKQLIMCHDSGFTINSRGHIKAYNSNNNVSINKLTKARCKSFEFEEKYKGNRVGVCDFDEYLSICGAHNKKAYITVRESDCPDAIEPMLSAIRAHNMTENCIINSNSLNVLEEIRAQDNNIRLSYLLRRGTFSDEKVDEAAKLGNSLIVLWEFPEQNKEGLTKLRSYLTTIDYARFMGVDIYAAIIDSTTYKSELQQMGIKGAQISCDTKAPIITSAGTIRITSKRNRTAVFLKAANRRKVIIPASVTSGGLKYRITEIEDKAFTASKIRKVVIGSNVEAITWNAFKGSKAKKVVIKSRKLKQSRVKGAFRKSRLKKATIRVGNRKANKAYSRKYKRTLRGSVTGRNLLIR